MPSSNEGTDVSCDLPHALLEHRVASGLTDDDICPLHHHNTDEEGCVACEFNNLALLIGLYRDRGRNRNTMYDL